MKVEQQVYINSLLYIFLFFIGCKQKSNNVESIRREILSNVKNSMVTAKSLDSTVYSVIDNCVSNIDSGINNIFLSDSKSFKKKFGNKYIMINPETDCIIFLNTTNSETLTLHHESGGDSSSFDIFTVTLSKGKTKAIKTKEKKFISSKGVYIGMPENSFSKRFNLKCFIRSVKGNTVKYSYHSDEQTFLSEYTFLNGKLISYRIGYDNS
jgi:hypothetical protein